jgi:hypothetical protein
MFLCLEVFRSKCTHSYSSRDVRTAEPFPLNHRNNITAIIRNTNIEHLRVIYRHMTLCAQFAAFTIDVRLLTSQKTFHRLRSYWYKTVVIVSLRSVYCAHIKTSHKFHFTSFRNTKIAKYFLLFIFFHLIAYFHRYCSLYTKEKRGNSPPPQVKYYKTRIINDSFRISRRLFGFYIHARFYVNSGFSQWTLVCCFI